MLLVVAGALSKVSGQHLSTKAAEEQRRARELFERKQAESQKLRNKVEQLINEVNDFRQEQWANTLLRLEAWFETNGRRLSQSDIKEWKQFRTEEIDLKLPKIKNSAAKRIGSEAIRQIAGPAAGALAPSAAKAAVSRLGKAGTGRSIAQLHGASREKAIMANLGGGPISKGGGGIARGEKLLDQIADSSALTATGLVQLAGGLYATQAARRYESQVEELLLQLEEDCAELEQLQYYCKELQTTFSSTQRRALEALAELESLDFDSDAHAQKFMIMFALLKTLLELRNIPIIEEETFEASGQLQAFIEKMNEREN